MSDTEGYVQPPPTAERYFDIARGDAGGGNENVNGPAAVTAFALLSIAKSLIDIKDALVPKDPAEEAYEAALREEQWAEEQHTPTGSDGSGGFGHQ